MSFYRTLLSIVVEHDYYSTGACSCLEFHPTDVTQRVFDNAGLLSKNTDSGMQLAYDESSLEALQLYAEDGEDPLCFVFKAYANDRHFKSFTEPFSASDSDILYFDNRASAASNNYSLSVGKNVSAKDFKDIGIFAPATNYRLDAEEKPEEQDPDKLRNILGREDYLSPPVFVLRIFAANRQGSLLQQWLDPEPTVYSVHFNSRRRYWKYYLLGTLVNGDAANNGFQVTEKKKQFKFKEIVEESKSGLGDLGTDYYAFRSVDPIPLKDNYSSYEFQLEKKGRDDSPVIARLPVASNKQVGMEAIAEQETIVSEIYINS